MTDFALMLQGMVILPDRIVPNGYVAVADGRIAEVGHGQPPSARESHHLGAALILPGAIDAQVHSLSQKNQEDFIWSTRAAAAGGVTTIVDMPYDEGDLICSAAAVERKVAHAGKQARVDFALYGTIDPTEGAARIAEQAEAGVAAFKFSTFGTDPKRFPRIPPPMMAECFAAVAPTGLTAGVHNEDDEYVRASLAKVKAAGADRASGNYGDLRDRRGDRVPGPCRSLLARPGIRDRGELQGAGLRRDCGMPHPLPDAGRGERCTPTRRPIKVQSSPEAAGRGREALASPRCGGR
jgi:Amidohydrolase family